MTTDSNRLAELVACLAQTSDSVARIALDGSGDPEDLTYDPLAAVASALVTIRRNDMAELAGTAV